jgi:hypothetical protein
MAMPLACQDFKMRVYRLSQIGPRLPRHHRYGPVRTADDRIPGFEVFKGPIYSIAATIGYAEGSIVAGHFTPADGYDLMLVIDVHKAYSPQWGFDTWSLIHLDDVEAVRSLPVADLHAWLRQQPACLGPDGHLSRDAVITWVSNNKQAVESWLEQHSESQPIQFTETIDADPPPADA